MQKTWSDYVGHVVQLCTPDFWDTLQVLRYQPAVITDQILKKFYSLLKRADLKCGHAWPSSLRSLNGRIKNKAGWFWDNVLHERTIDLRRFDLSGVNKIRFTFVDPLYLFVQQCNKLHALVCFVLFALLPLFFIRILFEYAQGQKLLWEPCVRKDARTGEDIYGSGIECGLLLRAATNSIPPGEGRVALINLSWDGGITGNTFSQISILCS